jgi:hypothetical protein
MGLFFFLLSVQARHGLWEITGCRLRTPGILHRLLRHHRRRARRRRRRRLLLYHRRRRARLLRPLLHRLRHRRCHLRRHLRPHRLLPRRRRRSRSGAYRQTARRRGCCCLGETHAVSRCGSGFMRPSPPLQAASTCWTHAGKLARFAQPHTREACEPGLGLALRLGLG